MAAARQLCEGVSCRNILGRAEAGHIAPDQRGEIHSLVTNQEYKYAFNGNQGIVAGARSALGRTRRERQIRSGARIDSSAEAVAARIEIQWAAASTAIKRNGKWHVIEYNIRIGVTSGPMILRMLRNPAEIVLRTARNEKLDLQFNDKLNFGCSLALAGYGYPFTQVRGPQLPLEVDGKFDCDVWWNEVARGRMANWSQLVIASPT